MRAGRFVRSSLSSRRTTREREHSPRLSFCLLGWWLVFCRVFGEVAQPLQRVLPEPIVFPEPGREGFLHRGRLERVDLAAALPAGLNKTRGAEPHQML